jgi:hypothetical protein
MEFTVQVNEYISGRITPDFANDRVSLKDTYLSLRLAPAFEFLAGKAHRPFSLLTQTSSLRMPVVERGLRIRGVGGFDQHELVTDFEYADRALGLQVRGELPATALGLEYGAGVFNGPTAPGPDGRSASQAAARASIQPVADLRIGAGWSGREFRSAQEVSSPGGDSFRYDRGNAWELDAEYGSFSPGLHVLGEISRGDADPSVGREFFGAQLWSAYRVAPSAGALAFVEPAFRVSYGDIDDSDVGGTLLTPGINLYFDALNRIMINLDWWNPDGGGDSVASFKTMFQMAF